MQLAIFDRIFSRLSLDAMLNHLARFREITAIELGTGGWPGSDHVEVDALLASRQKVHEFCMRFADAGITISALSCHNNPVHPDPRIAADADATFRKTVQLAERLDVPTVVTFSGCPGGGPQDLTPNWVTASWPPEYLAMSAWQWEERLIPYWQNAAHFAEQAGVRIAIEAQPGFCVYNTHTLQRLRAATSKSIGINLDPSHLWWQGIDIPTAITDLGKSIFHFHAKDVAINEAMRNRNGILDTKSYREMAQRSWLFRSVGWGHSELEWKRIASALRHAGYDYVMSIEHEDALASTHEGLSSAISMLSRVLLKEPPVEPWWT